METTIIEGVAELKENDVNYPGFNEDDLDNILGFVCRICLEFHGKANDDDLISPCKCKGTQRFIHRLCLDRCRFQKKGVAFSHCSTCKSQFLEPFQYDLTFKLFVETEIESIREVLDRCTTVKSQRRMLAHIYQKYRIKLDGILRRREEKMILHSVNFWILFECHYCTLYHAVDKAYMFQGVSDDLIHKLVSKMKFQRHTQRFMFRSEPPSHFYIVVLGAVELTIQNYMGKRLPNEVAYRGDMIGEVCTICCEPQFFNADPYKAPCVEVLTLYRTELLELLRDRLSDAAIIMNNIYNRFIKKGYNIFKRWPEIDDMLYRRETDLVTLHLAAIRGNYSLMHQLLNEEEGSDPNDSDHKGRTALHLAASKGCEKCVRLLLDHGANPNCKDQEGSIPLWEAMLGRHESVVKLLRQYGAEITYGDVAKFAHIAAHHQRDLNLLKQIAEFGGDVNHLPLSTLIDSKITQMEMRSSRENGGGNLELLFRVVTFDYVRQDGNRDCIHEESIFGSATLSVDDLPNSVLVNEKKCLNEHDDDDSLTGFSSEFSIIL